jgi:hypothetical protein
MSRKHGLQPTEGSSAKPNPLYLHIPRLVRDPHKSLQIIDTQISDFYTAFTTLAVQN